MQALVGYGINFLPMWLQSGVQRMTSRYSMDDYGQDTVRANNNSSDISRPTILSNVPPSESSSSSHNDTVFQDTVTSILSQVSSLPRLTLVLEKPNFYFFGILTSFLPAA